MCLTRIAAIGKGERKWAPSYDLGNNEQQKTYKPSMPFDPNIPSLETYPKEIIVEGDEQDCSQQHSM